MLSETPYSSELAILILAFNEELKIAEVINKSKKYGYVIVVNDGSHDKTEEISRKLANHTISHKKNLGYDLSIKTGIEYILSKNFNFLITIDGDNQHPVFKIPDFVNILKSGNDIVIGNRNIKIRFFERLFCLVSDIFWGVKDPMCGMKAYQTKPLKKLKTFYTYDSIGTEIMFRLLKKKYKLEHIYIDISSRSDNSKFGYSFSLNLEILRNILKSIAIKFSN